METLASVCFSASGISLNVETTLCSLLKTLVQECKAEMLGGRGLSI